MKKKHNIFMLVVLLANFLIQPIVSISTVFAQAEDTSLPSQIEEIIVSEPVVEEPAPEVSEEVIEETPVEDPPSEESEVAEESSESSEEELEEESDEESDEEKDAVSTITYLDNGNPTSNLRTGSTNRFSFNVNNTGDSLENAIIRVTLPLTYLETYGASGQYFPGQGIDGLLNSRVEGNNLVVDYNVQTLSETYNQNFTFEFKSIDNGTMPNGAQIPVTAAVVESGSSVAQTSNVTYQFVTRQPHFSTNIAYPAEANVEDDEEAKRQTEVLFSFSFGEEGGGNGSGRSDVHAITVTAVVPESLSFDASLNEGWQYDEASRTASYSFIPEASIYDAAYAMPTSLSLRAANNEEDIQASLYAEARFTFANGDVVNKSNQAEVSMMAMVDVAPLAAVEQNLVTNFKLSYSTNEGVPIEIENGSDNTVNPADLNAILLQYALTIPNDLPPFAEGETYTMPLPSIAHGIAANNVPILIGGVQVASYSILENDIVITFNEAVNTLDNVVMHVNLNGVFNQSVFDTETEVRVEIPYSNGDSFSTTIRAEQQEYDGLDLKEAGHPYVLNEEGKIEVDRNPTHVDWTVRVNDSAGSFTNATIIDDLGANLAIVPGSFVIEKIIRNYNNVEIGRETVTDVIPTITDTGFELDLGSIENAYSITYTTMVSRPDGGGTLSVNNNARIILDGTENPVSDVFQGTWSGDLPSITKRGSLDGVDKVRWVVEYNYSQETLGAVTLTDTLSEGEIDLTSVLVYEVTTDIDGNVVTETPITITPQADGAGNVQFPGLDANGKAYRIEFASSVPVGLNGSILNKITDDQQIPNSAEASVDVNTIPTGGKIGEQGVDESGRPYIDWTITMNSSKLDVPKINVKDVFNREHLDFDVTNAELYRLTRDSVPSDEFSISDYTHTDGRSGFELNIADAGPHEYKFIYRTYYTTLGMQQTEVANEAALVFADGEGVGIGETITPDVGLAGPKAGINKSGRYLVNTSSNLQEIDWTINFNTSKILLENPTITDNFTSGNYSLIEGSLTMTENGIAFTDYTIDATNGFVININKKTNATYQIKYRTTADDTVNLDQTNKATLMWQGGNEEANASVSKRHPGMNKSGKIVVNADGTKSVNWTINFNTNSNVIHNFVLTDTNSPATVAISNIKVTSGGSDVTEGFNISTPSNGVFTIAANQLRARPYQLTYTTTLSAEEEVSAIKNTATITYLGGSDNKSATVPSPTLGVSKKALSIDKTTYPARINWSITANTDTAKHLVNLVGAVLADEIPADQRLVLGSIKATQVGTNVAVDASKITESANAFSIILPNGAYQYTITFQTEVIQYPSMSSKIDRYTNMTTLTNTGYKAVTANAYIDYYGGSSGNQSNKTGSQNPETENVDWTLRVNPDGLPIVNATIIDTLTSNHSYVSDSIILMDDAGVPLSGYTIKVADDNRSFRIDLGAIDEPYRVSYSTRLNPSLVGNIQVGNTIQLLGGTVQKELDKKTVTSTAAQWFFGGGGSGTQVSFNLLKQHKTGYPISEVHFNLKRIELDGRQTEVIADISTDSEGIILSGNIRAGRYILEELVTPNHYQQLTNPIYFIIAYTNPAIDPTSEFTVTLTDSNFNAGNHSHATASGNSIIVNNDIVTTSISATKVWQGSGNTNLPETWFQLYRYTSEGTEELVAKSMKKLASNATTETVVWDNIDQFTPAGVAYNFLVREIDAAGNPFTPKGYYKVEDGLTVTNIYIEEPVINAAKQLIGRNQIAGEFEFLLADATTGDVFATATNDVTGSITFTDFLTEAQRMELSQNGSSSGSYVISENVENPIGGMTYDGSTYRIDMTMTFDSTTGSIRAEYLYRDGTPIFRNSYEYGPSDFTLEAEKVLTSKTLEADQFSFELVDAAGVVIQTKTNDINGKVFFDSMTYEDPGTYYYKVREVRDSDGGVTYDGTVYDVAIVVTDNTQGELVANAHYINGPLSFTNTYQAAPDRVIFEASKTLNGSQLVANQFSFQLIDKDNKVIQEVTNNANGQVIFNEIEFSEVGVYDYTIREFEGNLGGVTYDTTVYPVQVIVTDNGAGQLVAEATYLDGPAAFTNTYATQPDSISLIASKTLTGQALRNGQFSFELVDSEGTVVETVLNNANGQVIFSELQYDEVGEHTYTIREVAGDQGGVTYDSREYVVTVTATDDGAGQLVAEAVYEDGPAHFTNTYQTSPDSVVFEANKTLTGQALRTGQFTFELVDEADEIIQRVTNNAQGQVIFGDIHYDEVGEYHYIIRETEGRQGGVTYDATQYWVTVTVVDDGEGQLVATTSYVDGPAAFENTYDSAPDKVIIQASKALDGKQLVNGEFNFELVDEAGAVLQTVSNNGDGQINFGEIHYDEAGEHTYTVREVVGNQSGITYDTNDFTVIVSVVDDGEGQLAASVLYPDGPVHFTNTYTTTPDRVVLEASKVLEGQVLRANQFAFELVDSSGTIIEKVGNTLDGNVYFSEIEYDTVGIHTYLIREVAGTQGGVTYDPSTEVVTITVVDNGEGQLVATTNYIGGPAVFTNRYEAAPNNVVLEATKVLEGQTLRNAQFSFELVDSDGTVVETVQNNANGQVIFSELYYSEVGEHSYLIREVAGTQGGMTYDAREFAVNVTVTDDGEGQLVAEASYTDGPAAFTNTYETASDSVVFEANKTLEGQVLRTGQFSFELVDSNGTVVETVQNNANGQVIFSELHYTEVGEHSYIIREVEGTQGGVKYDTREFSVNVSVTDDGEGQLIATSNYLEGPAVFTNTYEPAPDSVMFEASKVLEGQVLRTDQFSFELVDAEGTVLETVSNNTSGQVIFNELHYTEVGEYSYIIREVEGTQGGVTYDRSEYTVNVVVTDDGEGQLTAEASYTDGPANFINTYETAPDNVILEARKTLEGQVLRNGQFSFELLDGDGEVIETIINNSNGQVIFSELHYTEVGEHSYIIREVEGTQGGVTYDTREFAVNVSVTDNGKGQLVAEAVYADGPAHFTNTYQTAPDSVVIEASKVLEGQTLRDGQFTFEVVNEADAIIQRVTNNAEGQVIFDEIQYDEIGEHSYIIREVEGHQGGVTYDATEFGLHVIVSDDGEGQLVAELSYSAEEVIFNNSYTPVDGSVIIEASKELIGQNLTEDRFEFNLLDEEGNSIQTVSNNRHGQVNFDAISYDVPGVYTYYIEEINDAQAGITYDEQRITTTVNVTDNGEGQLESEISYDQTPTFTNAYSTENVSVTVEGLKQLVGRDLQANEFYFTITDESGTVIDTVSNDLEGQILFNTITYTEPGTHTFIINELESELGGIKDDQRTFTVVVQVTDNNQGELVANVNYVTGPVLFTNTYETAHDSIILEVTKTLENKAIQLEQFGFELRNDLGEIIQTKSHDAFGNVYFDELEYTAPGTYNYTLSEVNDGQGGIIYDSVVYDVVVEVIDNGEGLLVAEAVYRDGPAHFTNTYETAPDSVVLDATKTLEGQALRTGQFSFELVDIEGTVIETVSNNSNGQVIFDEIHYDEVGEHSYIIREVEGTQGGVTYDIREFSVNVSVTDDGEGQLVAEAVYEDGPAHFTNTYQTAPDSVVFEASKVLEGQTLRDGQFTFELVNEADAIIQRVTNNAAGQIIFDEIQYDEIGEHSYIIREVEGRQGGVTYDTTEYAVDVTVTDNGEGQLVAEVVYLDGPVYFTNTYETSSDNVVIQATKTLNGKVLVSNQFAFELLNEAGDVVQTVSNNANGQIIFYEIRYDAVGDHTYTVREVLGDQGGITYDVAEFNVTVAVTDDGEGQLVANATYLDGPVHFTNTYTTAPDSVVIEASKVLEGQVLRANQFAFELIDESGTVIQTVRNNVEGNVYFDEIHFDKVGTHTYLIREIEGTQGGVTYDSLTHVITINVVDDGKGQLVATSNHIGGPAVFTNTYQTLPDSVVFEASKVLEGQVLRTGQFSFELVDAEGTVIETVSNNTNGQIIFNEIHYDEIGEHNYIIREVEGTQGGMTYDRSEYAIHVVVTDDGEGQLITEAVYADGPAHFTNTYQTAPDSVVFEANKVLEGQILRNGQFSFELVDAYGTVIETVSNNGNGQVIFSELHYTGIGEHNYIIREVEGTQGGVTYDAREFVINVSVTDDGEGQLIAEAVYADGPAHFTNAYQTAPDSVVFEASKVLEGQVLRNGQFSFALVDAEGTVIETVSNNGNGQVIFNELHYTEAGEYSYTIHEVEGTQGGVTYDTTEYTINVTVTDNGKGQLEASVDNIDGPAVFKNSYEANSDSIVIEAIKVLEGQQLVADQFTFELLDSEGKVIDSTTNDAVGQIVFNEMNYDEIGEYTYTILEVTGTQNGITYDQAKLEVTVTVTDDQNGQLQASAEFSGGEPIFTNIYEAASDSVVIEVTKVLEGKDLAADEFDFELLDEAGEVIQTTTNNGNGQVIFDEINYDQVGDYRYTIREAKRKRPNIIYDEREIAITVSVIDDGEGQLVASLTYPELTSFTNRFNPKNPTTPNVPSGDALPSTGDSSSLWYGLMTLGLGLGVVFTAKRRKEEK